MSNKKLLNLGKTSLLPGNSNRVGQLTYFQNAKSIPKLNLDNAGDLSANNSAALNSREFNLLNDLLISYGNATNTNMDIPEGWLSVINNILSNKYVRLPNHLGENKDLGDNTKLRDLLNRWVTTSGPDVDRSKYRFSEKLPQNKRPESISTTFTDNDRKKLPNDSNGLVDGYYGGEHEGEMRSSASLLSKSVQDRYNWIYDDPFDNKYSIEFKDPDQFAKELDEKYHFGIGYKYYQGFTIGNNNQWAIQLYPYKYYENGPVTGFPRDGSRYCLVKDLPSYQLPISMRAPAGGNSDYDNPRDGIKSNGVLFEFSRYLPAMSWTLNMGSIDTMNFELFNGSEMVVPMGFKYNMSLSLELLDDMYGSLDKYFRSYINTIYDQNTRSVAPYWACAFWIPVVLFRDAYNINYRFNLIGIPTNFGTQLQGAEAPQESRVSLEFSIIGIQTYNNGNGKVFPGPVGAGNDNMRNLTWNDITLRAN